MVTFGKSYRQSVLEKDVVREKEDGGKTSSYREELFSLGRSLKEDWIR